MQKASLFQIMGRMSWVKDKNTSDVTYTEQGGYVTERAMERLGLYYKQSSGHTKPAMTDKTNSMQGIFVMTIALYMIKRWPPWIDLLSPPVYQLFSLSYPWDKESKFLTAFMPLACRNLITVDISQLWSTLMVIAMFLPSPSIDALTNSAVIKQLNKVH